MARATVSTTAMAMSPPVPPVHALTRRATPVRMRAPARKIGTLTDSAPAACSRPMAPAPISSTLRTMPAIDRFLGGVSSLAEGPHDAPPPPLGGAGGGGSPGGGVSESGSVGASSDGGSVVAGGGGDHGYRAWDGGGGRVGLRRRSSTPITM